MKNLTGLVLSALRSDPFDHFDERMRERQDEFDKQWKETNDQINKQRDIITNHNLDNNNDHFTSQPPFAIFIVIFVIAFIGGAILAVYQWRRRRRLQDAMTGALEAYTANQHAARAATVAGIASTSITVVQSPHQQQQTSQFIAPPPYSPLDVNAHQRQK